MILGADEIMRSLRGVWDLLHRRARGLSHFRFDEHSFWRSFRAPLLALPVVIVWLAAERAQLGLLAPGVSLFDDPWLTAQTLFELAALWLTLPMLGILLAHRRIIRERLVPFIIVCNWGSVLAAAFLAVPALLFAIGWATPELAMLFGCAAALMIMQMRWYTARVTLGVTGGIAALMAFADALIGIGLLRLMI